jgi:acetyl-CoA acetyltransferase
MSARFCASNKVAVAGYAHSAVERHAPRPLGALAVEVARQAIADAGLQPGQVDGIVSSALFPTSGAHAVEDGVSTVTSGWMAEHLAPLGTEPRYVSGFQGIGQIPGVVSLAVNAVASGAADYVLMFRALHNPPGRYHGNPMREISGAQQWTAPQGFFGPLAMIALPCNEYLQRYGATREEMAAVVVEARKNGARIPWSYWHKNPLTEAEYLAAPMLTDPVCRYDCDIPVDGVAAFVFTSADRARDLPNKPVYVAGYASGVPSTRRLPLHWPLDDIMAAGSAVATRLWQQSGIGPGEVDLPQVYDGFSPFVWFWLEALGYCPPGEAHRFAAEGGIDSDRPGAVPALSGGGALGNGRMHGIPQMLECYLQLSGRAGDRQRERAETGVACHSSPHYGGAVAYSAASYLLHFLSTERSRCSAIDREEEPWRQSYRSGAPISLASGPRAARRSPWKTRPTSRPWPTSPPPRRWKPSGRSWRRDTAFTAACGRLSLPPTGRVSCASSLITSRGRASRWFPRWWPRRGSRCSSPRARSSGRGWRWHGTRSTCTCRCGRKRPTRCRSMSWSAAG